MRTTGRANSDVSVAMSVAAAAKSPTAADLGDVAPEQPRLAEARHFRSSDTPEAHGQQALGELPRIPGAPSCER
jgi:hypothetical protein